MKWFCWFEERKQRRQTQAKAELEGQEKKNRMRASAEKQLLPVGEVLGVAVWHVDFHPFTLELAGDGRDNTLVTCWFDTKSGELEMIAVGMVWDKLQDGCMYFLESQECQLPAPEKHAHQEMMARALFCLGVDAPDVLAQLDPAFTHHEKLELRLSMPRELWPQKWLDEEKGGSA